MNREELAWAAGFFDGEGCTYWNKSGGHIGLNVCQACTSGQPAETLQRFRAAVGGLGKLNRKSPTAYALVVQNFEHVQAIIAMLWFWLSDRKREQYKKTLEVWRSG